MDKEKAIWWVNMLFDIQQLEFVKNGNMFKANEIEEVKEYIVEHLQKNEE